MRLVASLLALPLCAFFPNLTGGHALRSARAASITSIVYHTTYTPSQEVKVWRGLTASLVVNGPGVARAVEIVTPSGGAATGLTIGLNSFRSIPTPQITLALSSTNSAVLGIYKVRIHYPLLRTGSTPRPDSFVVRLFDRGTISAITKDSGATNNTAVGERHHFTATGSGLANATISDATLGSLASEVQVASRTNTQVKFSFVPKAATTALDITASDFFDLNTPSVTTDGPWGYGGSGAVRLTTTIKPIKVAFPSSNAVEGQQVTGTVFMSGPVAPGAQVVVALRSSSAYATVPAQTVVSGTSATFSVSVLAGAAAKAATITASTSGSSASASLSIIPASATLVGLQVLDASPTPTLNTGSSDFKLLQVVLAAPAGAAGEVVQVSANPASAVSVPSTVTVPAGQTWVQFRVRPNPSDVTQMIQVSASLRDVTLTKSITVLKPVLESIQLTGYTIGTQGAFANRQLIVWFHFNGRFATPQVIQTSTSNAALVPLPASVSVQASAQSAAVSMTTGPTTVDQSVSIAGVFQGTTVSRVVVINRHPHVTSLHWVLQPAGGLFLQVGIDRSPPPAFSLTVTNDNPRINIPSPYTLPGFGQSHAIQAVPMADNGQAIPTYVGGTTLEYRVPIGADVSVSTANLRVRATDTTSSSDPGVAFALQLRPYTLALNHTIGGAASAPIMTVTLNAKAPPGGAVITLTKSGTNAGRATIPSSITIPAGQPSVTYPVTVAPGQTISGITFTATYSGLTKSVTAP